MAVRITIRIPANRKILLTMLEALVRVNQEILRSAPRRFPTLYKSGVRYRQEGRDKRGNRTEDWLTIPELYRRGYGDCEDLVGALVAQLRASGVNAKPWIYKTQARLWHVVVKMPDGRIEDPSARLGMKTP